jgi:predicted Zn-ribbon and HTH transcriptional regulator
MSKQNSSLTNYDSQSLINNTRNQHSGYLPIFILCDTCYWCATYVEKTRIPAENKCPECNANNAELTSFLIPLRKSFTFNIMTNVEWSWSLRSEQTPDKTVT